MLQMLEKCGAELWDHVLAQYKQTGWPGLYKLKMSVLWDIVFRFMLLKEFAQFINVRLMYSINFFLGWVVLLLHLNWFPNWKTNTQTLGESTYYVHPDATLIFNAKLWPLEALGSSTQCSS